MKHEKKNNRSSLIYLGCQVRRILLLGVICCFVLVGCGRKEEAVQEEAVVTEEEAVGGLDSESTAENSETVQNAVADDEAENAAADTDEKTEGAEAGTDNKAGDAMDVEDAAKDATAADDEYVTLEDYCNDPQTKSEIDSKIAELSGVDGMEIAWEVKENEFIYIYKYTDSSMNFDGATELLDASLEENASVFEDIAKQFDEVIGQDGACVATVRFLDPDGNILSEKSFKAQ